MWAKMMQDAACRAGPGTVYEILGYVAAGQSALTYGTDLEGDWWWIQSPDGSRRCWISNLLVSFQSNLPEVPILTPEPTPRDRVSPLLEKPAHLGTDPRAVLLARGVLQRSELFGDRAAEAHRHDPITHATRLAHI